MIVNNSYHSSISSSTANQQSAVAGNSSNNGTARDEIGLSFSLKDSGINAIFAKPMRAPDHILDRMNVAAEHIRMEAYRNSPEGIEDFVSRSKKHANQRDTVAVFSVEGKVVAHVGNAGTATYGLDLGRFEGNNSPQERADLIS
ncbi:MAG: hypothetical protein OEM38_06995 [Gammaproteobacteria bacterium]|nr:hypothetical protein [Gammaproteobacteria bacterium]